jgi:hypothetical protein
MMISGNENLKGSMFFKNKSAGFRKTHNAYFPDPGKQEPGLCAEEEAAQGPVLPVRQFCSPAVG